MDQDLKIFRELVLWLWEGYKQPWEYSNQQAQKIYQDISLVFNSVGSREALEKFLPSESKVQSAFPPKTFLYLDPVTRDRIMVPALWIKCDFGRSIPEVRLRLGFFLEHEGEVKAFGYRFEAPEGLGPKGEGRHHYYHAQFINRFQDEILLPPQEFHDWFPTSQPAFPLDADDPVKLVLCLLISLYGLDDVGKLMKNSGLENRLNKYLKEMRFWPVEPIKRFWKVEIGDDDPPRYLEYYATEKKTTDFEKYIKGKYTGCRIVGITKGCYEALPKNKKKSY